VVVLDNYDRQYLIQLNKACREKNVGFIYAGNLGLYGFTFVDFGEKHKVLDATGEQEKSIHIAGIAKDETGLVYLHDEKKHGLSDGDTVTFR
jgi:ubiquitin-activating enzyme E1